ncbi:GAF domain-containing protein [Allokutzneria albata]|uniref:GAF domain-containing protein n=1 Tax=Allokutzneria albata TaxID=211114 RepID=A0A1G9SG08_ALLAB|nr:GAF domain-containing protein [Allokutzneria albata]SDM34418.1 GAF domain-containing protein [Allokutzneria albata]
MRFPERHLQRVFAEFPDILTADVGITDFLGALARCSVGLLGVTASGILLADRDGAANLVAATTDETRVLGLSQLRNNEGPCVDACHSGKQVHCPDLAADNRWPTFTRAARAAGFAAVHALPMRLHEWTIGAMGLFSTRPGRLDIDVGELAQTLADVAATRIVSRHVVVSQEVAAAQLQKALDHRIAIAQAGRAPAQRLDITVGDGCPHAARLRPRPRSRTGRCLKRSHPSRAVPHATDTPSATTESAATARPPLTRGHDQRHDKANRPQGDVRRRSWEEHESNTESQGT